MVAILHTTNAFGAGFDLLHIANYSAQRSPQLHLIYPTPPHNIAGYSVNSEGDLIAICAQYFGIISIVRLSHGLELYRINPQQFDLSPFVGLSFAPGVGTTLMTVHSGKYAIYWDIKHLGEKPTLTSLANLSVSWNKGQHCITPTGDTLLLNGVPGKSIRPTLVRLDSKSEVEFTPIKRPFFDRCQDIPSPITIANDGNSAVIGSYLYSFSPNLTKKLSIPKKSKIVRTAMKSSSTVAFAVLLPNEKSQVRIHNWSSKSNGYHDWTPPDAVLNIWGLAFDKERFIGAGVQLRSDGLDTFAVILVTRLKGGNLFEFMRTEEWEIAKPIKMAFGSDGSLIVLTTGTDTLRQPSSYSIFVYNIPSDAARGLQPAPSIWQFNASTEIPPTMTSAGHIFYLGVEEDEGWIIRANHSGEHKKIAWCPLSWRSIGNLSLICASKGDTGTVICLNKVLGVAVIKVGSEI